MESARIHFALLPNNNFNYKYTLFHSPKRNFHSSFILFSNNKGFETLSQATEQLHNNNNNNNETTTTSADIPFNNTTHNNNDNNINNNNRAEKEEERVKRMMKEFEELSEEEREKSEEYIIEELKKRGEEVEVYEIEKESLELLHRINELMKRASRDGEAVEEAIELYEQFFDRETQYDYEVIANYINLLTVAGEYDDAAARLDQLFQSSTFKRYSLPHQHHLHLRRVQLALYSLQFKEAKPMLDRLMADDPRNADVLFEQANFHFLFADYLLDDHNIHLLSKLSSLNPIIMKKNEEDDQERSPDHPPQSADASHFDQQINQNQIDHQIEGNQMKYSTNFRRVLAAVNQMKSQNKEEEQIMKDAIENYHLAMYYYHQTILSNQNHYIAHIKKGMCLLKIGMNNEAISIFKQALLIDRANPLAYQHIYGTFISLRKFQLAMEAIDQFLAINSTDYPIFHFFKGVCHFYLNDFAKAAQLFEVALQNGEKKWNVFVYLAKSFLNLKNYQKAIDHFLLALEDSEEMGKEAREEVYSSLGYAYQFAAKFGDSILWFNKAITLDPTNHKYHYAKHISLLTMKKYNDALAAINKAVSYCNTYQYQVSKGVCFNHMQRMEEALECFNQAISMEKNSMRAYVEKSKTLKRLNRMAEAKDCDEIISFIVKKRRHEVPPPNSVKNPSEVYSIVPPPTSPF